MRELSLQMFMKNIKGGLTMKKQPKHPCIGCIYFKACGETNRTEPCEGRMTKSEKKMEESSND